MVSSEVWNRPYSREVAAFPAVSMTSGEKQTSFTCPVAKIFYIFLITLSLPRGSPLMSKIYGTYRSDRVKVIVRIFHEQQGENCYFRASFADFLYNVTPSLLEVLGDMTH